MERAKNIETLSLCFTAGVAAGTAVGPMVGSAAPALLLPLVALPVLLRERLLRLGDKPAVGIILGLFLLLGVFCALNAAIPVAGTENRLTSLAAGAAESLRAFIGSLPFPSEGTAPLLQALLTGDRSGLAPQTIAAFRGSGASHILALSGLHMGMLYIIFDSLTKPLGRSRPAQIIRFVLVLGGAGFFTLMTGAGPSIVRAFLFIALNETLRLLNRPRKATRVFCVALLIQLVLDPSVISSLGFQLSYLAMAGIFLLYPMLEKFYPEGSYYNPLRWIWKAAAMSISCQVFTAPLVWFRFHTFPKWFLLTNLLAVPLTTLTVWSAVIVLTFAAAGICPQILLDVTDALCRLLTGVLEIIASM